MRIATFLIAGLSTIAWLLVVGLTLWSASDPATADLDMLAGVAVTIVYCLTAVPALLLLLYRRAPRIAFALAIAFPVLLGLLLTIVVASLEV